MPPVFNFPLELLNLVVTCRKLNQSHCMAYPLHIVYASNVWSNTGMILREHFQQQHKRKRERGSMKPIRESEAVELG